MRLARAADVPVAKHSHLVASTRLRVRPRAREVAAVFVACLLATIAATWPLARYMTSRVPLNLADPLENVWIFSWAAHAMAHAPLHIWSGNIYYPAHHTLAFAESMLGLAIPAAPIYWITGNGVFTVNAATFAVFAVCGLGTYLLIREITGKPWPSLVAAIAFAVAPYRIGSIGHPHVIAVHLLPFVLWALIRGSRPVILALLVTLQFYTSFTGAEIMMLAIASWFIWEFARRGRGPSHFVRAGIGVIAGIVLAVPVVIPYFVVAHDHPENRHAVAETMVYSATPQSYISPEPLVVNLVRQPETWAGGRVKQIAPWEKHLFPGIWASVAGLAGLMIGFAALTRRLLRSRRRSTGEAAPPTAFIGLFALMGAIGFCFSLGPRFGAKSTGIPLPFAIVTKLPGNPLRVPARLGELVIFAFVSLGGVALARLPERALRPALVLSLVVLGVEVMPASLATSVPPPITTAHRAVASTHGAVLILPTAIVRQDGRVFDETMQFEAEDVYLSTAHFHPVTNGYGSFIPTSAQKLLAVVRTFPSIRSMTFLRGIGVATVVVRLDKIAGSPWWNSAHVLDRWPGVGLVAADSTTRVYDISAATLRWR